MSLPSPQPRYFEMLLWMILQLIGQNCYSSEQRHIHSYRTFK
uniref:Uncharacterized protein n=1 Tax=Parascaris equorum TaxID=6256 RepID=A0A914RWY0_PAREQ